MAIDRIEVVYKIVTPMFCGGALPKDRAELRLPSFKGVLRWWWRALAWSRFEGNLSNIQKAEDDLFGSAREGQGKVIMRLLPSNAPSMIKKDDVLKLNGQVVGEGARYLGYGVMEAFGRKARDSRPAVQAGQLTRGCLQAPFDLRIELRARDLDEPARASLLDALRATGLLGGVGAKSRKGYGSLVLQSIAMNGASCWSPTTSVDDLGRAIQRILPPSKKNSGPNGLPPYTALSPQTRVVLVSADGQSQPLALLDRVGREIVRFRSKGRRDDKDGHHKVLRDVLSENNFNDDHQLMVAAKRTAPSRHPRRIVFGLPHNYSEGNVQPANFDRRASPLLIHMHECGTTPVAVLSILPAQFLPGGDDAIVNVGGRQVRISSDQEIWKPLDDLLDRFLDSKKRKELFGQASEVQL